MCQLAIWSAQSFKRKLSFLVDLGLFQVSFSRPFQTVVAHFGQWPPFVKILEGFPCFQGGSGIYIGTKLLTELSLPFHGFSNFE